MNNDYNGKSNNMDNQNFNDNVNPNQAPMQGMTNVNNEMANQPVQIQNMQSEQSQQVYNQNNITQVNSASKKSNNKIIIIIVTVVVFLFLIGSCGRNSGNSSYQPNPNFNSNTDNNGGSIDSQNNIDSNQNNSGINQQSDTSTNANSGYISLNTYGNISNELKIKVKSATKNKTQIAGRISVNITMKNESNTDLKLVDNGNFYFYSELKYSGITGPSKTCVLSYENDHPVGTSEDNNLFIIRANTEVNMKINCGFVLEKIDSVIPENLTIVHENNSQIFKLSNN